MLSWLNTRNSNIQNQDIKVDLAVETLYDQIQWRLQNAFFQQMTTEEDFIKN
jgi:hypothetical protein